MCSFGKHQKTIESSNIITQYFPLTHHWSAHTLVSMRHLLTIAQSTLSSVTVTLHHILVVVWRHILVGVVRSGRIGRARLVV